MYKLSRVAPGILKRSLLKKVRDEIGEMVDVEKHFSPRYNPWDQRSVFGARRRFVPRDSVG